MNARYWSAFAIVLLLGLVGCKTGEPSVTSKTRSESTAQDAQNAYELGLKCLNGDGVPKDQKRASDYFKAAADHDYPPAQAALGACYYLGYGVPVDYAEAVKWFAKAAAQNVVEAQVSLGKCYYKGDGVLQDQVEAVKWFRRAAEAGEPQGQTDLAACLYSGAGVQTNWTEAEKWWRKAADQNYATAQVALGRFYLDLTNSPDKRAEGLSLLQKGAAQGDDEGKQLLADLEKANQEQMAKAMRWTEANRESIEKELTQQYQPERQRFLQALNIEGTAFFFVVDDVAFVTSDGPMKRGYIQFSPVIAWKAAAGTGGVARTVATYDLEKDEIVGFEIAERKDLSSAEVAELLGDRSGAVANVVPPASSSKWEISNETFNKGVQTLLTVGAAWLAHALTSGN